MLTPAEYDAWYSTARGRWIGHAEWCVLQQLLAANAQECVLDVGCGTGWFTRQLSQKSQCKTTGVDVDEASLNFARSRDPDSYYQQANACALPYPNQFFDCCISITCLNFIADWPLALSEMVRVSRRRLVVGVLNHNSLLYRDKARSGGTGAHRDAQWFRLEQIKEVLSNLAVTNVKCRSVIFMPNGSLLARTVERVTPNYLTCGGVLIFAADALN